MEKRKVDIYYEALSAKDICSVSCYELGIFGYLYDSRAGQSILSPPPSPPAALQLVSLGPCAAVRVFSLGWHLYQLVDISVR